MYTSNGTAAHAHACTCALSGCYSADTPALSMSLSICLYIHPSTHLFIHLSIHLSIYLHLSPSIYLSIYPCIHCSAVCCVYCVCCLLILLLLPRRVFAHARTRPPSYRYYNYNYLHLITKYHTYSLNLQQSQRPMRQLGIRNSSKLGAQSR